jgi:hypothetical protein
MSNNIRIAVMISGEIRNYNTVVSHRHHPKYFIDILKKKYNVVDVFGYTWAHCDDPIDIIPFKKFNKVDQRVIKDWVNEDFMYRAWSHEMWNPQNRMDQLGPEQFVENVLNETCASYGQHWAGFESFAMPDIDDYDIFIRFRWDLGFDSFPSAEIEEWVINRNIYSKISWIHEIYNTEQMQLLLTTNNSYIHPHSNTSIEDTVFFMNKGAMLEIRKHSIQERLLRVFNNYCNGGLKAKAHTLWHQLIMDDYINVGMHIDNIFSLNRSEYKEIDAMGAKSK